MARNKVNRLVRDPKRWEAEYLKTRDVRYAALAIGRWGRDAPDWAFWACNCFEKVERLRVPGQGGVDHQFTLRLMSVMVKDEGLEQAEAARRTVEIIKKSGGKVTVSVRRLENMWIDERNAMLERGDPIPWPGLRVDFPRPEPLPPGDRPTPPSDDVEPIRPATFDWPDEDQGTGRQ